MAVRYVSVPEFVVNSHPLNHLARVPEMFRIIFNEAGRLRRQIGLIASEGFQDEAVLAAAGSVMSVKYAEGYPGRRYYAGCEYVDMSESNGIKWGKTLYGAEHANVQPHSGSDANREAIAVLAKNGDVIVSMDTGQGGHLSHGSPVTKTSRDYVIRRYGVTSDGFIDFGQVRELALMKPHPKVIIAGGSAYSRIIDYGIFRDIADEVGAALLADIAHPAGLVAAGLHPNPIGIADIVTATTQKTQMSGRGGWIFGGQSMKRIIGYDDKQKPITLAEAIDKEVFPGQQGGPLMNQIAAKAVGFYLALNDDQTAVSQEFIDLQRRIIKNAQVLANEFTRLGYKVITGGTDTHLALIELEHMSGLTAQRVLYRANITLNRNGVPGDRRPPYFTSGIRVGSPWVTVAGMGEEGLRETVRTIDDVLHHTVEDKDKLGQFKVGDEVIEQAKKKVAELNEGNPLYKDLYEAMKWFKEFKGI